MSIFIKIVDGRVGNKEQRIMSRKMDKMGKEYNSKMKPVKEGDITNKPT